MSASPHNDSLSAPPLPSPPSVPAPTPTSATTTGPPVVSPSAVVSAPSPPSGDARLVALLSDAIRERDELVRELSAARKRADKFDRLLASLSQPTSSMPSGAPAPSYNALLEYEARIEAAETARDDAETRRRVIAENWSILIRHLEVLESQAAEARSSFSRVLRDGGGGLLLDQLPQLPSAPSFTNVPAVYAMRPPGYPGRHHIPPNRTNSVRSHLPTPQSTIPFSNMSLPPPPTAKLHPSSRVRPRASSTDGSMEVSGQPPPKKSRGTRGHESDRRGRSERSMFTESVSHDRYLRLLFLFLIFIDLQPVDLHMPQSQSYAVSPPLSNPSAHPPHSIYVPHRSNAKRDREDYHQRLHELTQEQRQPLISLETASQPDESMHYLHTQENEILAGEARGRRSHRRSQHHGSSRSSSHSSSSSLSVDALLLQASGTDDLDRKSVGPNGIPASAPGLPAALRPHGSSHHRHRVLASDMHAGGDPTVYPRVRPESPSSDYRSPSTSRASRPHHSHQLQQTMTGPGMSAEAMGPGPLSQPGQLQTYQTHVFAPVVTGEPVKKTKYQAPPPPELLIKPAPVTRGSFFYISLYEYANNFLLWQPKLHLLHRVSLRPTRRASVYADSAGCRDGTRMVNASKNGVLARMVRAQCAIGRLPPRNVFVSTSLTHPSDAVKR